MVAQTLEALEEGGVPFCHVDARVSDHLGEVGEGSLRKVFRLLGHCARAVVLRFTRGADTLYYVPAPAKRSAILRDILALAILRPFFPRLILHWHAVGLGAWAGRGGNDGGLRRFLSGADPAIVIAEGNSDDAEVFRPRRIEVVANGIPDPCPNFADDLAGRDVRRGEVIASLTEGGGEIRVASLGHCTETKGFFDLLEAMEMVREKRPDVVWTLDVAGGFLSADEERRADLRFAELRSRGVWVRQHGFLRGEQKAEFFRRADVLTFPSWSESFGLVAVEALAFGVPVIGSDIPGIRAVLDGTGCRMVAPRSPEGLATALLAKDSYPPSTALRQRFEEALTVERFRKRIVEVLRK